MKEHIDFDSTKFYLGQLCKRNHEWNTTGQSIRRRVGRKCLVCENHQYRGRKRTGIISEMITNAKRRSTKKGYEFDISKDFIEQLNEQQNGRCIYTNILLEWDRKHNQGRINNRASIDRIDSRKGYTKDNVQLVSDRINWAKGNLTHDEFIELCKTVTERFKNTHEDL